MTSLNFLHLRTLIKMKHRKEWDKRKVMAIATKSTSTITGMPRGTDNHSKVEDGAIRLSQIDDVLRDINIDIKETWMQVLPLLERYSNENLGNAIVERNIRVFRARYEECLTFEEIADSMCISLRWVKHIVKTIEQILESYK